MVLRMPMQPVCGRGTELRHGVGRWGQRGGRVYVWAVEDTWSRGRVW